MKISIMRYCLLHPYQVEIGYGIALASVFLSHSYQYSLPVYPGYFLLQTFAVLLFLWWLGQCRSTTTSQIDSVPWLTLFGPMILCTGWTVASSLWAAHSWAVPEGVLRTMTWTLSTIGLTHLFTHQPRLRAWLWDITLAVFVVISLGYLHHAYFIVGNFFTYPLANPNFAATIFAFLGTLALLHALYYRHSRQSSKTYLYGGLSLWFILLTLQCGGKWATISMVVVGGAITALLWPRLRPALAWLAVPVVVVLFWTWPILWQRIMLSLEIRLYIWEDCLRIIQHSWLRCLAGWGSGNFFPVFPDFQDPLSFTSYYQASVIDFPHNFFLEIWIETGLVGLVLWLVVIALALRRSWRLFAHGIGDRQKAGSLAVMGSILVLCADSLSSLGLSYGQIQMLLALCLAWLFAQPDGIKLNICTQPTAATPSLMAKLFSNRLRWFGMVLVVAIIWKYYSWDSLMFHRNCVRAQRVVDLGDRILAMAAIEPPVCQNYYTCKWRDALGSLAIDAVDTIPQLQRNPALLDFCFGKFLELEQQLPKFGFFLLNRAVWEAKQHHPEAADRYFQKFAQRNPFAPQLWFLWQRACSNQAASAQTMLRTALDCQRLYGQDGALLYGEAVARELLGEPEVARQLELQVQSWIQLRMRHAFDARAKELERFLQQP